MKKRLLIISATFILLAAALVYLMAMQNFETPVLAAQEGVITFDGGTLGNRAYMLTGEWKRYSGALTPGQLKSAEGDFVRDIRYIRKMRGCTYAFTVLGENAGAVSFLLPRPHTSRLWINGTEVTGESGGISSMDLFKLSDYGGGRFDFVLQVHSGSINDVYQGVLLGRSGALRLVQDRWLMLDVVAMGLSAMLILLSLSLFARKRSEKYLLLVVASTFVELGQFLLSARSPLLQQFSVGSPVFYRQLAFVNYFICREFVRGRVPKFMDRLVWCVLGASVAACIAFPVQANHILRAAFFAYMLLQLALLFWTYAEGNGDVLPILIGAALAMANEVFYTLLYAGLLPQGSVDVQIMPAQFLRFSYVLGFAVATCLKFAAKYQEAEQLSGELEQRVRAQTQALVESHAQLEREQKQRQRFVTGIVHNLRSPLFTVSGNLELLRGEIPLPTPEQSYYMEQIDGKLDYISRMVNDMLLVSRLEEGGIRFRFTEFPLDTLLESAAQDARSKGAAREVAVRWSGEQGLMLTADQFRLKQALDNLMDNAVRFSPDGGTVRLSGEAKDGERVRIAVEDEGKGVDEALKPGLFMRAGDRVEQGSAGLGLVIVRQIAERHGGTVALEKSDAGGSRFVLELPLAQPMED